jgi:hypothetical protein
MFNKKTLYNAQIMMIPRTLFAAKFSDNYLLNSFDHGSQTGSKMNM